MMCVDLQIKKLNNTIPCWGTGFVAMDIVDTDIGDFAAVGGSCGNVMALLAWLGWHTVPVARLGQDASGAFIRDELQMLGVHTLHLSEESKAQTPIVLQRFDTNKKGDRVHRFSLMCPECGGWLPRHRPITIKQANTLIEENDIPKVFYFDRVSPGALKLASIARTHDALVIFEPSSIGDEKKFQAAVDICHILKYSRERLGHVPDLPITPSPMVVIETQGARGLRFRWRNRWTRLEAFEVGRLIDAAGSGDWCTAGLIHQIGQNGVQGLINLNKAKLASALQIGQALAAINCRYYGARGAMQALSLRDINVYMRQLRDQLPVNETEKEVAVEVTVKPPVGYCLQCTLGNAHQGKVAVGNTPF